MQLSVYVPDDLGQQLRSSGLNVSAICQRALHAALAGQNQARLVEHLINQGREW